MTFQNLFRTEKSFPRVHIHAAEDEQMTYRVKLNRGDCFTPAPHVHTVHVVTGTVHVWSANEHTFVHSGECFTIIAGGASISPVGTGSATLEMLG